MVRRGHQIETDIGPREVVDRQVPRLEQQMRVDAVGDDFAVEFDPYAPRRRLEHDLVIGIRLEP
jgi:hypothetical protein